MTFRFVLVIALVALSSRAYAQPAGAQAEVLFREGRDLMKAGKYAEACTAFDQSQKLEPAITTLLNLAGCREKAGQLATAWGLFLEAERQTRGAKDGATKKLNEVAKTRAEKLEPKISKLTINVMHPIDGLEISRDKDRVDTAMWNRALPIDGGTYTITATAPDKKPWTTQVTVAPESESKTVEVPDLAKKASEVVPPTSTAVTPPVAEEEEEHDTPPASRSKAVPIAIGVAGVAMLGGAVGFHLWGNAKYDDAKAEMTDQTRRDALYDSANQKRFIATGLGAAGIAAAGVSIWLFLRGGGDEQQATVAQHHVVVAPTSISLVGSF